MSITYINRKGRTYYLCEGVTKTGKPRYLFSREPKGELLDEIPDGYKISESVNGIVSLAKAHPVLLSDQEIEFVKAAIKKHPQSRMYRLDVKSNQMIIYEQVGPDLQEVALSLATGSGYSSLEGEEIARRLDEEQIYTQYTPVMKFSLSDVKIRQFRAKRMCYFDDIDDWIDIAYDKSMEELVNWLIPTLGTEEFFELY